MKRFLKTLVRKTGWDIVRFPPNEMSSDVQERERQTKANLRSTAYPPAPIAVLRLDTDWYESTRHELEHLFPRLADRGVLIIDDYGHWQGSRKATDEFLARQSRRFLLHRVDYSARILINA